jgi:hypothetical protein
MVGEVSIETYITQCIEASASSLDMEALARSIIGETPAQTLARSIIAGTPVLAPADTKQPGFWLVWGGDPKRPPTVRHSLRDAAEREAGRLARVVPGTRFFVLAAVESFVMPPSAVVREKLVHDDDEVPF